ncbi:MAG: DUF1330 domain-containing protein [Beijerinckiaceae bacterium]|nr:DUF1330 domain-containing protein [Beijerinckiaceae bacterium]
MAKGYIIARVTVDDNDAYMRYAQGALIAMKKYGARVLARGGKCEALDGEARPRNVILEFESYDQAKAYFNSPEYQAARAHRVGKSVGEFVLVEGFDGPQPNDH